MVPGGCKEVQVDVLFMLSGWQTFQFLTIEQFTHSLLSVQTKAVCCAVKWSWLVTWNFLPLFCVQLGGGTSFGNSSWDGGIEDAIVEVIHDASMQSLLLLLLLLLLLWQDTQCEEDLWHHTLVTDMSVMMANLASVISSTLLGPLAPLHPKSNPLLPSLHKAQFDQAKMFFDFF